VRANLSMSALRAYSRTTCQTAFSVSPSPHAFPFLFTLGALFYLVARRSRTAPELLASAAEVE
jgi:hypothetical protein